MKEIQLLCYVISNGDVLRFPSPPPNLHLPDFGSRGLGTLFRQGAASNSPCPHPSILPPVCPPPQNHGPQNSASSHGSIVCVGSSSARLLSGAAPRHVLYAQTDDAVPLARQPRHKDNNVLPRSFINTLSSPRQPHSK